MTLQQRTKYVLLLALSSLAVTASAGAAPQQKPSDCLRAWFDTRYGNAGYDHIVRLASTCSTPVTCEVSSDAAPQPVKVEVLAGRAQEVVILRGSPARQFTPHAECQFSSAVAKGDD
jgi:hypothetical protein